MGSSHHGFCVMRDGPGAGDLPPAQVSVLCRGHPGTSQGLSTPALASVLSERGARQASLINEETGLGRSVTARPRPVAGKGAPWTPPDTPQDTPRNTPQDTPGPCMSSVGHFLWCSWPRLRRRRCERRRRGPAGLRRQERRSRPPLGGGGRGGLLPLGFVFTICKDLEEEMVTHCSILAGESHGQRSLAGYSPPGRKELDMTKVT